MDRNLRHRLMILRSADQIDDSIVLAVENFVQSVEAKYAVTISEDNGSMLVNHLAMALARIQKGKPVGEMSPVLLAEIKASECYGGIELLISALEADCKLTIPASERGFIALHVASIAGNTSGGDK